jgi:H+/Cl- antiporter ClcA
MAGNYSSLTAIFRGIPRPIAGGRRRHRQFTRPFSSAPAQGGRVGMAGYFAGVVQARMTAFVIILEMTGNHDNVIALMLASMLGYDTARLSSSLKR